MLTELEIDPPLEVKFKATQQKNYEKLTSYFSASSNLGMNSEDDKRLKSYITVSANKKSIG